MMTEEDAHSLLEKAQDEFSSSVKRAETTLMDNLSLLKEITSEEAATPAELLAQEESHSRSKTRLID